MLCTYPWHILHIAALVFVIAFVLIALSVFFVAVSASEEVAAIPADAHTANATENNDQNGP